MVYSGSGLRIIDDLVNLILDHYYLSVLIIGVIIMIVGVVIMIKKHEEHENKKPSVIMEFFSILNDVFKTK